MYALADQAQARIDITVWASDPLSRAGTVAQLRNVSGLRVLQATQPAEGSVALVVADEVDADVLQVIRALRLDGCLGTALLVTRLDDRGLLQAVEAGVGGILRRNQATVQNIVSTVRSVAAGEGAVPPDMLARLLNQVGHLQRQVLAPRGLTFSGLTERELSVLRLLADGYDTNEVGGQLFYSERTVKNIIHDVTSRLELRNRTHAVAYAIKQGLI
ncbi:MAG TPA: response regulator transcription factor [Candidatus Limnocylindrales bacterium]